MNNIPRFDRTQLMGDAIHLKSGNSFTEIELHWHDYFELIYYEDADVVCEINGNLNTFKSGTLYLLTPFDFHRTVNQRKDSSISFINISFSGDAVDSALTDDLSSLIYIKDAKEHKPITDIFKVFTELGENIDSEVKKYLLSALLVLVKEKGECIPSETRLTGRTEFNRKVFEYLAKNFASQITLSDVAAEMHLAPAYFSSLFTKNVGCTFISYLTYFRLNYSKQLLKYTDKSVTQICYDCGFSSFSHFLREFKKHYGITPGQYRKSNLSQ